MASILPRSAMAAVGATLVLLVARTAVAANGGLLGASSDEHIWLVVEHDQPPRIELCHHALAMEGPEYRPLLRLAQRPQRLAAWGNRLWIVFPQESGGRHPQRETFTLQVRRNPMLGIYYPVPSDRLEVVAPLPGLGKLVGLVGTAQGPVALLLPPQWAGAEVRGGEPGRAAVQALETPKLLQLRQERWVELDLPESFEPGPVCLLAAGGEDGSVLYVMTSVRGLPAAVVYARASDGGWTHRPLQLQLWAGTALTSVDGHVAVVMDQPRDDQIDIAYLRPGRLLPLAELPRPAEAWTVLGVRDGLRLLAYSRRPELRMRGIDMLSGQVADWVTMSTQRIARRPLWHAGILVTVGVGTLLAAVLLRPHRQGPILLPEDLARLGLAWRLLALIIDLLPGALVALLLLRCALADLFRLPMLTADLAHAAPYLVMAGVTVLHSTITELLTGRSLGKGLVGARVVAANGGRPDPRQVLVRNLFKAATLFLPPLAVVALLNPQAQGLGDLVARTVVAGELAPQPPGAGNDR
jgi:uncharacterized RDD family membrane protein YckC